MVVSYNDKVLALHRQSDVPTAWLFGGGGAAGVNQVGFLSGLVEDSGWRNIVATFGVSTGALQAAWLAQGADLLDGLVQLWRELVSPAQIYRETAAGAVLSWISGLLGSHGGAYSLEPTYKLLKARLDLCALRASGIALRVGVVDFNSKIYRQWNPLDKQEWEDNNTPNDPFLKVLASCSIPGTFQGFNFPDRAKHPHWCFDGGVMNVVPQVSEAIALGAQRIVYCLCRSREHIPDMLPYTKGLTVLQETVSLMLANGIVDDVELARRDVERVNELVAAGVEGYGKKRKIDFIVLEPAFGRENVGTLDFYHEPLWRAYHSAVIEAVDQAYHYYDNGIGA